MALEGNHWVGAVRGALSRPEWMRVDIGDNRAPARFAKLPKLGEALAAQMHKPLAESLWVKIIVEHIGQDPSDLAVQ
jgi:hypothetical protein